MPAPQIIQQSQYDEIRDLLGNASKKLVSDATVERDLYLGLAEAEMMDRVPTWAAVINDQSSGYSLKKKLYLQKAVVAYCAYLLVSKVQVLVKSQDIEDYAWTNLTPAEWDALRARLLAQANDDIAQLEDALGTAILILSGPTRAAQSSSRHC